ncbi:hypothetical protein ACHAXR_007644 [Thalassiosira sp. AJA248-18]
MATSINTNDSDDQLLLSKKVETTCKLTFHGAAANSCPHSLLWVRAPSSSPSHDDDTGVDDDDGHNNNTDHLKDTVIYASSGVINLATSYKHSPSSSSSSNNNSSNIITSVDSTLVTRTLQHNDTTNKKVLARGEAAEDAAAPRSVTGLTWVSNNNNDDKIRKEDGSRGSSCCYYGIVAAFSDGTVTSWRYRRHDQNQNQWREHVLVGHDPQPCKKEIVNDDVVGMGGDDDGNNNNMLESIADISAVCIDDGTSWLVATASSKGIFLHISHVDEDKEAVYSRQIGHHAAASVQLQCNNNNNNNDNVVDEMKECYMFAGSASPRHNKIWVYTIPYFTTTTTTTTTSSSCWVALPLLTINTPHYHGHLLGHQDWITCFSWLDHFVNVATNNDEEGGKNHGETRRESLLASSGHDAKIRLWKFSTWEVVVVAKDDDVSELENGGRNNEEEDSDSDEENSDDEVDIDDLEEEEGEARLIISHDHNIAAGCNNTTAMTTLTTTAVSLEALLLGHEEAVTSLTWRKPQPQQRGNNKPCLLSSSMDRTILLWMEEDHGEKGGGLLWVPISRVGSAGGILGGSIGASLMGFVDAAFSPMDANRIVGHGYGGSIHFWTQQQQQQKEEEEEVVLHGGGGGGGNAIMAEQEEQEADAQQQSWVADPCITGHFRSVEDMAWEPIHGEYLLTTSSDQTTRLWTEVPVVPLESKNSTTQQQQQYQHHTRWVEVGRPQVHGYDMTSIVCIGGGVGENDDEEPCHRFVSGADEKVLRVFDAPKSTLRMLQSMKQQRQQSEEELDQQHPSSWRVERAFMPSLGLSNKATADTTEDQESSKFSNNNNTTNNNGNDDQTMLDNTIVVEGGSSIKSIGELKLPSERDLGVTTLWPESRKLFGHESELVCLDAYRAPSSSLSGGSVVDTTTTLVASSCKARNDVASAAIRLWDARKGKCVGILKGGHRSTVSTMSFSRDGKYLASSGKDRRICIWRRRINNPTGDSPDEEGSSYELSAAADSAHKRIVWSVHFCPARPDILASGSRDGLVKLWRLVEVADGSLEIKELIRFESSQTGKNPITAVAFAEDLLRGSGDDKLECAILSIGTESGRIEIWAVPIFSSNDINVSDSEAATPRPELLCAIPAKDCHYDTVKKISWRPNTTTHHIHGLNEGTMHLTLATCGRDNGVRIFKLAIKEM